MNEEPTSDVTRVTGLRRKRGRLVLLMGLAIATVVILTWAIVKSGAQRTPNQAAQSAANAQTPGMYAEVIWPVGRRQASLFVPPSAIATTTERTFVIRIRNGTTEWVDVKRGQPMGDLIEVFGALDQGDEAAVRGTDELREGTQVIPNQPPTK